MTTPEYEWWPDPDWTADPALIAGHKCTQPRCNRPAVAAFFRTRTRAGVRQRVMWCCCDRPDHLHGRQVDAGVVEAQYLIGSPAQQRAKDATYAPRG